jgi:hypothetical protein
MAPKVEENKDTLLWEEEIRVRQQVSSSRISTNFFSAFLVNTYATLHIFAVYLISFESLLSIGLSVGMTVCESDQTTFLVGSYQGHASRGSTHWGDTHALSPIARTSSTQGSTIAQKKILRMMDPSWTGSSYPLPSSPPCLPPLGWPLRGATKRWCTWPRSRRPYGISIRRTLAGIGPHPNR